MQVLVFAMLTVVTTFEFFATGDYWGRWLVLPSLAPYLAELLAVVVLLVVVVAGVRDRFQHVRAAYWIVFGALLVTILCGVVVNNVGAGPTFAGIRTYLRAIPWFLLPAVVMFRDGQIRAQLAFVLVLAVIQVPFAIQQRLTTDALGHVSGDFTAGTLVLSGALSIFMVCCLSIAAAFFVRGRLKAWQFILLFIGLLLPTTLNETKVTIFILPIGLLIASVAASQPGRRTRYVALSIGVTALAASVFVPVYDHYVARRQYAPTLMEFMTDPVQIERYLSTTSDVGTDERYVGRLDSITVPLRRLSSDPSTLMFGLGVGNASHSILGRQFTGEHYGMYGPFLVTSISRLVLEIGVLGSVCVLVLMWLIFRDATMVARQRYSIQGALAAGWMAVTGVVVACMFYIDTIVVTSLSFLFWYFSGVIAAARMSSSATLAADNEVSLESV